MNQVIEDRVRPELLSKARHFRVEEIVDTLKEIEGVDYAWRDDFDSCSINVFIRLDDAESRGGSFDGRKPYRFNTKDGTTRSVKIALRRIFAERDVCWYILDYPVLKYNRNGGCKVRDGYDGDTIKIEVQI